MPSRLATSIAGTALVLAVAACGDDDAEPAPTEEGEATVTASGMAFHPDTIEVAAGASVVWENEDTVAHTVTAGTPGDPADGAAFDEQLDPDGQATLQFEEPGEVAYYCAIHPAMTGEIVVTS